MVVNPIVLLPVDVIGSMISIIEKELPGYWYSISQKKDMLTLSLGPSVYCILDADRAWSETKEGDQGIIVSLGRKDLLTDGLLIVNALESLIRNSIREAREIFSNKSEGFPEYKSGRRVHDRNARQRVRKQYAKLIRELPGYISEGIDIGEVYLGSCHTSADCSLRGKYPGKPFDISVDLTDRNAMMDMALSRAMNKLVLKKQKLGV